MMDRIFPSIWIPQDERNNLQLKTDRKRHVLSKGFVNNCLGWYFSNLLVETRFCVVLDSLIA